MAEQLLSASWYRVAHLRPRIRAHARFHRHRYRGRSWWVLQDRSTGRCHRLSESAWALAGLMDGQRTTHEVWEAVCTRLGDDAPTQDETIRLLGLLDLANVLDCDVTPNTQAFLERQQRRERQEWWRRYTNPLSIRVPLFDPQPLLERHAWLFLPLFGRAGAVAFAGIVSLALLLAGMHGPDLARAAGAWAADPRQWLVLVLIYPIVKALHEAGHALATHRFGAEVHEMGILFLALVPVPYVDASAAAVLPDRGQRAVVGAAGIAVELVLASLALFVWLSVGPGWVSSCALAVLLLGGTSTLLFNGNPLLRYDGYYVLADWLEIPNLYGRSREYLTWLVKSRALGLERVRRPVLERGEEKWLLAYGLASWAYRVFILAAIALFFAGRFFFVGVLLAIFTVVAQGALPLLRGLDFLATSPQLTGQRTRAVLRTGVGSAVLLAALFVLPLPLSTRTQGVVWPGEQAQLRARAPGFVTRLLAEPGTEVEAGQPLVDIESPALESERAVARARVEELRARLYAERYSERAAAEQTERELAVAQAALARSLERQQEGTLRAGASGRFVTVGDRDWTGRFVEQGELLGWVLADRIDTVRVVVSQDDAALVRDDTESVEVRTASRIGEVHRATVRAQVPAASDALPARSLGSRGGGPWVSDPDDPDGLRVAEPVFQLDLAVESGALGGGIGERVYVRFDHGSEPVGWRAVRALRRLFLRRLDV